jgi:hypothetical protein
LLLFQGIVSGIYFKKAILFNSSFWIVLGEFCWTTNRRNALRLYRKIWACLHFSRWIYLNFIHFTTSLILIKFVSFRCCHCN